LTDEASGLGTADLLKQSFHFGGGIGGSCYLAADYQVAGAIAQGFGRGWRRGSDR
jgi:hypothetical protein